MAQAVYSYKTYVWQKEQEKLKQNLLHRKIAVRLAKLRWRKLTAFSTAITLMASMNLASSYYLLCPYIHPNVQFDGVMRQLKLEILRINKDIPCIVYILSAFEVLDQNLFPLTSIWYLQFTLRYILVQTFGNHLIPLLSLSFFPWFATPAGDVMRCVDYTDVVWKCSAEDFDYYV